jgi:glucokinase
MTSSVPRVDLPQAERPLFLGVDVGGTNIKLGLVDNRGRTIANAKIETHEERGPAEAFGRVRTATDELLKQQGLALNEIARVGLGVPGTMDIPRGMMLEPHNLPGWYNSPVRDLLSQALNDLPVAFANDANAAAFGESWVGTGHQYHSIVLLTLGTGVGGGIIIGDLSVDGENSAGSECGHIIVDSSPTARFCPCGKQGHLEAYCSATALIKRTEELLESGRQSSLITRISEATPLTALMIDEEAEKGDALSLEVIDELAHWLGVGVVTLMHCIDPGAVILGGAMTFGREEKPVGRRFIKQVRQFVQEHAFPVLAERTKIEFASLGGDAGYIGAAGIARVAHRGTPWG